MKKISMFFAVMAIMMGVTNRVWGQATNDTKPNDAHAQILSAIALTAVQELEFGGIVPDATNPGTVILDNADERTKTGSLTLVTSKVIPKSGAYTVTGTGLVPYVITVPTASFNITNTTGSGVEAMAVTAMTCSKGALTAGSVASVFLGNGTDAFKVGGTLAVAGHQAPGLYTGTFNVTVAY